MASKSARKYAASVATVVAISEKMLIVYGDRQGCAKLKMNLKKLHAKSWQFLKVSMGEEDASKLLFGRTICDKFDNDDVKKVGDVIAECSEKGLDSTRSWSTLISYMCGILESRLEELKEFNGCEEKKQMAMKLLKMSEPISEHFTSRMKRTDFTEDGVRLVEIFEGCW